MTKADQALIERLPLKGTSLIDVYKWLIHNHFIKSKKAIIDNAKTEIVFVFTYDPNYKRYANYTFELHIKAGSAWAADLRKFDAHINTYFLTEKLYVTSPMSFMEYDPKLEEQETVYFYLTLNTPKGDTIFLD